MANHPKTSIDAGLARLEQRMVPGVGFTLVEIAEECDCSLNAIWLIFKSAKNKVLANAEQQGIELNDLIMD